MPPTLARIVLDGASRHRLSKGFILSTNGEYAVDASLRQQILQEANRGIAQRLDLAGFGVEAREGHPSLVGLSTPFLPIHDLAQRDAFVAKLASAAAHLLQAAAGAGCGLLAAGVNPCYADGDGQPAALCADVHQIEVYDDGEIERIYNLYRQFLPELLAVSTHSAVYGGEIQKDFSLRMRVNPSSFLPRYLSQFSAEHLARLGRMMRKDYGLSDLRQMDVNPLGGDAQRLTQSSLPLLGESAAAVELRFVDAQCSFPFIRAQVILFQAIAMYGRALARQGKRLPYMRDEVIDQNKAAAIQGGAGVILVPDAWFKQDDSGRGYSYHNRGVPERSTTALLMIVEGLLLPALQNLGCQPGELAPIVLGAELRRRGKLCFANYAEYQQYLYYTARSRFTRELRDLTERLLSSPTSDAIVDYNHGTFADLSAEIEAEWTSKLTPRPRLSGRVTRFDAAAGVGLIRTEQGEDVAVERSDLEGLERLDVGQTVTFEIARRRGRALAIRVRAESPRLHTGRIARYDEVKDYGFIADEAGGDVFVHRSQVLGGVRLTPGDSVTFELGPSTGKRPQAVRVEVQRQPRARGVVKWFDSGKHYGFITSPDGTDIYVRQSDLEGVATLEAGCKVSFEVGQGGKGPRAIRVSVIEEE